MLIGVQKRFVFVANSKTASTSIEAALMKHVEIHRGGTPQHKHIRLRDVLVEYDFLFGQPEYAPETFFKFGVMRDPIDWIGSWFRFRKGNDVHHGLPAEMTLAEFWEKADWNRYFKTGDGRTPRHQRLHFEAEDGTLLADYIIPYHELGAHFGKICDALGLESPLPRKNVSKVAEPPEADAALLAEMRDFYAEDYALFDRLEEINRAGLARLAATRGAGHADHAGTP